MRMLSGIRTLVALVVCLFVAAEAYAQSGSITGTIRAAETGAALPNVVVEAVSPGGQTVASTLSDMAGTYRLSGLEPGTYAVVMTATGYETARTEGVTISSGANATVDATLATTAFELDPVIVSASRRQEKALDAPAHVEVVGTRSVEERPALSVTDHVRAVPGVDIASTGLVQSNVVTRGFNNVFSGALLMITDNRYASVPSLRFNASYMIPTVSEDVERIEVLLGPASAMYGPNSANGVLHVITRSPFESEGTTLSLAGGERSVFQGSVRHASVLSEQVAFKVSGQYQRGDDWEFTDPVEQAARAAVLPTDPETLIGLRDFDLELYKGDARVDWRPADNMEAIFSAGATQVANAVEMTGLGAAQARDWLYTYVQGRFRYDRLFLQAFGNFSNAGDTYLLRTGEPIVDESRVYVAQAQHGFDPADWQSFTYGVDYQRTEPRTDGTILGRNEGVTVNEIGGYLQSETNLSPQFDLIASARIDSHDYINETVFSPSAALVFKPREGHSLRLTYNRAFDTPTSNHLFLDLEVQSLDPLPISVRALGVPTDGLSFRRDCTGGVGNLCMRTPFSPDAGFIPANAALAWPAIVQIMQARGVDLSGIPAPGPTDVGTVLRVLNPTDEAFHDVDAAGVTDIDPLEPTITNTIELGYKGLLFDRLLLAADVYRTEKTDFIGPLLVETPSVFLDPVSLTAYLSQFMPAQQAQQLAAGIGGISGNRDVTGIPVGTVVPDHELTSSPDLYVTYRNFGDIDIWGGDLSAQVLLTDQFSLLSSYSYASENFFSQDEVGGLSPIALNAPQHKGSIAGQYRDDETGWSGELRVRYHDWFPMNSGVYIGAVGASTQVDAMVGYRLPFGEETVLTLSGRNLLDHEHQQFVGAPALGRLILARVQYTF